METSFDWQRAEAQLTHADELVLTEVDHLISAREGWMYFDPQRTEDVLLNLETAVQEAAMPYAVTTTEHEIIHNPETGRRTILWLGRTAIQNAMSGYDFHKLKAARERVGYEVDEAHFATDELHEGVIHVFISPRMTRKDATLRQARREHLGDDDAVRVSWLQKAEDGQQKRIMQSLLVRDVPLDAWTSMLADTQNIFGKSIRLTDTESALSVMRVHRELVLPAGKLTNGPVDLIEAVIPYITDEAIRAQVQQQLGHYYGDQVDMRRKAAAVAERWLEFELALAESLHGETMTPQIADFVREMAPLWNDNDLAVFHKHFYNGTFRMSRELAVVLERAKRNLLWVSAASVVENESVAKQMSSDVYELVRANEMRIQLARENGTDYRHIEAENNRLVGSQNVKVGGGCPGENGGNFREQNGEEDKSEKKFMNCPHCNAKVYDDPCAKILTCGGCKAFVMNGYTWSKGNGGSQKRELERRERREKIAEIKAARAEKIIEVAAPVAGLAMMSASNV